MLSEAKHPSLVGSRHDRETDASLRSAWHARASL